MKSPKGLISGNQVPASKRGSKVSNEEINQSKRGKKSLLAKKNSEGSSMSQNLSKASKQ